MGTMHRWVVAFATVIVAVWRQDSDPPSPPDVPPVATGGAGRATSGTNSAGSGPGRDQRNGPAGVTSDVNDEMMEPIELSAEPGPPAGSGVFGPGTGIL